MDEGDLRRPVREVFAAATEVEDYESEARWALIRELQERDGEETFRMLTEGVSSEDRLVKRVALDSLGQLGFLEGRPWLEESLPLVIQATDTDDVEILASALSAIGHLGDPRGLGVVLTQRHHEDAEVRFAVTLAVPRVGGDPLDPEAIAALIELMDDSDEDVRDWATFGLGVLSDADGPEVRAALTARLDDPDGATAGEALVGLARRSDESILPILSRALREPDVGNLEVEAAMELGDPTLLRALEKLKASGWAESDPRGSILDDAIEACGLRNDHPD